MEAHLENTQNENAQEAISLVTRLSFNSGSHIELRSFMNETLASGVKKAAQTLACLKQ